MENGFCESSDTQRSSVNKNVYITLFSTEAFKRISNTKILASLYPNVIV